MNLRTATAVGVSVVVVGGLIALAVPAVSVIAEAVSTTVQGDGRPTQTSPLSSSSSTSSAEAPAEAADASTGVPEGYVDLGDGTWIPAGGPGDCATTAVISISDGVPTLRGGDVIDQGARDGARGEVVSDSAGIRSYVVAPNDNLIAIGERLCVSYPTLMSFNHVLGTAIQPTQELILRPDASLPWIDPYVPFDAAPGTNTVAYNTAIYEMGAAVRARDIGAARSIWGTLAPDVSPAVAAVAARALDASDWSVLGYLFP